MSPLNLGPPLAESETATLQKFQQVLAKVAHAGKEKAELEDLVSDGVFETLLRGIISGSSHLSAIIDQQPDILLAATNPGPLLDKALGQIAELGIEKRPPLLRSLRVLKKRVVGILGIADLAGRMDLDEITLALTQLADLAISKLTDQLLLTASQRGEIQLADPDRPSRDSGLIVLGMGKLGAFELNYSSDVDLIVLFDPLVMADREVERPMALAVQIARSLTHLLEQKTPDGYIFRADLRLRPHLPTHPLALSTDDAEGYYERHGQNWERAAHVKARPVAGDIAAGDAYLHRLAPFLWRKHLDYAAIKDIQSIKRQINAHHGFGDVRVRGHNLKVGRGGIREIEFFAQTQQLILGGRNPELRSKRTQKTLGLLADERWIDREVEQDLTSAYAALRNLEHRLQMVADKQTHRMPGSDLEFKRFALFCGYHDADIFERDVQALLATVEARYAALFESAPDLGGGSRLVFTGTSHDAGTLETLEAMGFQKPELISETIRNWHHGHIRAMRSTRARELLTELTPSILASCALQPDKDRAFSLLATLITNLPAGIQLFSLFHANPKLLELVADLIGAAPKLVTILASATDLFEAMLTPSFFDPLPPRNELGIEYTARIKDARDLQDVLDISRHWAHGRQFQAGLQVFLGASSMQEAMLCLTDIAELMLEHMLDEAESWLIEQHGELQGGRFAILAMGKLGSRELTIGSDLDLVFIYDAPADARSQGAKPLPVAVYYARLGQRLITALTARTAEGTLYEIDTRLRPSGNAGPVACNLGNFVSYQEKTAETWEQQSLTRARPVAGDKDLIEEVSAIVDQMVKKPRDLDKLAHDVRYMRLRIYKEHGSENHWNLKHVRGGLVEIEFIAQYLQLAYAHSHPAIRSVSTHEVARKAGTLGIIEPDDARLLCEALDLLHPLIGVLRLSLVERFDTETATEGLWEALIRAAGRSFSGQPVGDKEGLEKLLIETETGVRQIFDKLCPAQAEESTRKQINAKETP